MTRSKKSSNLQTSDSSEPKTMEELLAKVGYSPRAFFQGQRFEAKVTEVNNKSVIFDIGGKSEGVVLGKDFEEAREFIKTLKPGDKVQVQVTIAEAQDGSTLLSLRQAAYDAGWNRLEKAKSENGAVAVFGRIASSSGITVDCYGLTGFIPTSQMGKIAIQNPQILVGRHFVAKVVEADRAKSRLVLSEKAVSEAAGMALVEKALKEVKEGDLYEGVVSTVASFGVFARIEVDVEGKKVPLEGLVHISEISWEKVNDLTSIYKEGSKIKVKVIGLKDGKVALSVKQARKDPWVEVENKYKVDDKVGGKITRISDFGVFVQLEPGIEGLIGLTKIPPGTPLKEGIEVNCYIEKIDAKNRKISLGLVLKAKPVGYK